MVNPKTVIHRLPKEVKLHLINFRAHCSQEFLSEKMTLSEAIELVGCYDEGVFHSRTITGEEMLTERFGKTTF